MRRSSFNSESSVISAIITDEMLENPITGFGFWNWNIVSAKLHFHVWRKLRKFQEWACWRLTTHRQGPPKAFERQIIHDGEYIRLAACGIEQTHSARLECLE